jgi:hypothetical protein
MARQEAVGSVASRPVKARTVWLVGGLVALFVAVNRLLRRPAAAPPVPARPDPRAEQLREKLAESRAAVEEMEREEPTVTEFPEAESEETPADECVAEAPAETVDVRRERVHERGKAAARKMRQPPDPPARAGS